MIGDYAWFQCGGCHIDAFYGIDVDPTSSTGCCITCGSSLWELWSTNVTRKDVFEFKLRTGHNIESIYVNTSGNGDEYNSKFYTIDRIA